MAKATQETLKIEKLVGVKIDLDLDEAHALYTVLCRVSGDPALSRRGLIDEIIEVLEKAGIKVEDDDIDYRFAEVRFENRK